MINQTATKIDGRAYAEGLRDRVTQAVSELPAQPTLAVVLVGEDPASQVYVASKAKFTVECGMRSLEHKLPADASEDAVVELVRKLNADNEVDGILVQLPLPKGLNSDRVIEEIHPDKDVDGLTESSAGRLSLGKPGLRPCTPTGCVMLAKRAWRFIWQELRGFRPLYFGRQTCRAFVLGTKLHGHYRPLPH